MKTCCLDGLDCIHIYIIPAKAVIWRLGTLCCNTVLNCPSGGRRMMAGGFLFLLKYFKNVK
jgi:hypothetical protein